MVFIGITGPSLSGKQSIANLLVFNYQFKRLYLHQNAPPSIQASPKVPLDLADYNVKDTERDRFCSAEEMMSFVLSHYSQNFVTIISGDLFDSVQPVFSVRPCYYLIAMDCPLGLRHKISSQTLANLNVNDVDVRENFYSKEESKLYARLYQQAGLTLRNDRFFKFEKDLMAYLDAKVSQIVPLFSALIRPSWDMYFLQLCRLASTRANCMKRKIGCVLVTAQTHRIVATGYNGTPRGLPNCNEGGCVRCNSNCGTGMDLSACLCIHAEENALLEAGRERIAKHRDHGDHTVLYCTTCPCLGCTKKIIQCGIAEVVYEDAYHMDTQTLRLLQQAGIPCRQISSPFLLQPRIYL